MQHIVRELRGEGGRRCDGDEQLRRIASGSSRAPLKFFGVIPTMVASLPIQAKRLSHRVGRGVEAIAPETIADHHHGRVSGLVESRG